MTLLLLSLGLIIILGLFALFTPNNYTGSEP
jgi:hypothetical protein